VLPDRGLSGNDLLAAVTCAKADFLARLSASRNPPVLRRLPDGSFLSVLSSRRCITVMTAAYCKVYTLQYA